MTNQPERSESQEPIVSKQPVITRFEWSPMEAPSTAETPSQKATVKTWKAEKQFGFVEPQDGKGDAFMHISAIDEAPAQGDTVHVLRIDNNDIKGRKVLEALTERGMKGREFLAKAAENQLADHMIELPSTNTNSRQMTGELSYISPEGKTYTLRFSRRDLGGAVNLVPSKLLIPDPGRYPELYTVKEGANGQPGSMELRASGLVMTQLGLSELNATQERERQRVELVKSFEEAESLARVKSLFADYVATGQKLDTSRKVIISGESSPVIECKLHTVTVSYNTESRTFEAKANAEFTARPVVGGVEAKRTAEVAIDQVKPEYDRFFGDPVLFQGYSSLRTFEEKLKPDAQFVVDYKVLGQPTTVAHRIETPQLIVEDAHTPPAKQVAFTFHVETPLGKRYYKAIIYTNNPNSAERARFDITLLPAALQTEYPAAMETVDRAYSAEMLGRAKKIVEKLPVYLEPTSENVHVHQLQIQLAPQGVPLTPTQQKWFEAASAGVEITPPYLDRKTKAPLRIQLKHLPANIDNFINHTSGNTLTGILHEIDPARFELVRIMDTLLAPDRELLFQEFPDLQQLKNEEARKSYELRLKTEIKRQLVTLFPEGWEGVNEEYLEQHPPEGMTPGVIETVKLLKEGWLRMPKEGVIEWPYVYNGKRYRVAPIVFDEVIDRSVFAGYHIFNEFDGVESNDDGTQRLVPATQIQRDHNGDPVYPTADDRELAQFLVPLVDEDHQPLRDESGAIVRCPVLLASITTHWEGDSMRGPHDTGARSSTETYFKVIQPKELRLQIAVSSAETLPASDEYLPRVWRLLEAAELPDPLRTAVAAKDLDALIAACDALDTLLDTEQKASKIFTVVKQLLRTIDPNTQRDWGYKPEEFLHSLKAELDHVRHHIKDQLTIVRPAFSTAVTVRADLVSALEAVKEKARVDALRKQGLLVNEVVAVPKAEADERIAFAYLNSDGSVVKSREVFVDSKSQRLYKEIGPAAVAVLITAEYEDQTLSSITVDLVVPVAAQLTAEQVQGIEQVVTQQVYGSAVEAELALAKMGLSMQTLRAGIRELQSLAPGKLRLELQREDGGKLTAHATKGDEDRELQVATIAPAEARTLDQLKTLMKALEKLFDQKSPAELRQRLKALSMYLNGFEQNKPLELIHALLLDIARASSITVSPDMYETPQVPAAPKPAFPSAFRPASEGLFGKRDADEDEPAAPKTLSGSPFAQARATLSGQLSAAPLESAGGQQAKSVNELGNAVLYMTSQLNQRGSNPKDRLELREIHDRLKAQASLAERLAVEAELRAFALNHKLSLPAAFGDATPEMPNKVVTETVQQRLNADTYREMLAKTDDELKKVVLEQNLQHLILPWRLAVAALSARGYTAQLFLLDRKLSEKTLSEVRGTVEKVLTEAKTKNRPDVSQIQDEVSLGLRGLEMLQVMMRSFAGDILKGTFDGDEENRQAFVEKFYAALEEKRKETQKLPEGEDLGKTTTQKLPEGEELDKIIYDILDALT